MSGMFNPYEMMKSIAQRGLDNQKRGPGDYIGPDGLLRCGVCGEARQTYIDVANPTDDDPDRKDKMLVTASCRCEKEREEAEKKAEQARKDMEYISKLRGASLMDEKFRCSTFDSFKTTKFNARNLKLCQRYATGFNQMLEKNQGLIFWGDVGTGKSYAAACIANYLLARKIPVVMTSFVKILAAIQKDREQEQQIMSRLNRAKLVIFDDLGAERDTSFGIEKVYSEAYRFVPEATIPDESLTMFYEGNGLFAKIIDAPAEEALKHGFGLDDVSDQEVEDFYREALDELDWEETAMTAIKWARLFGGSLAVMLINDGRGLEEPLDWKNIKSIDDIRVYDRSVIQPDYESMFHYDPRDPFRTRGSRLGMPEYYSIYSRYGSFTVHESRCLVFQNGLLPENSSNSIYQFWGMPEYVRIHRAIQDAEIAHRSAPRMLDRSVQPVYKMKDLAAELATEEGENKVFRRLQTIDMARGMMNSITIDSEGEDYDFRTFQFAGVADVIDSACNYLSALTNIPQNILFGRSPTGMSDTGEADLENWYNFVERIQKRMLKSNLRYLLSVIFQAGVATGEVDEVPKIKVKFNPLWSLSDTEQADLDQKKATTAQVRAQTAQIYVDMQAIDPTEVRRKLADSSEFDVETLLDEYEDEDELMAAYTGEVEPGTGTTGIFESGDFAQYAQGVDINSHDTDPGSEGSAPANAPAATKLPQDMSAEEVAEAEQIVPEAYQGAIETAQKAAKVAQNNDADAGYSNTQGEGKPFSVGVLVISEGKVLTGTRHNDFGYGLICGPGGHGEKGETPEQAAFRETEEEFGISPTSLIPLGTGPVEPDTGLTPYLFLCTEYEGEPDCVDLEMTNAKFRTLDELDQLAASMFQPFADGLEILKTCIETALFFGDDGGDMHGELVESIGEAVSEAGDNTDGGPGSGNHGHEGNPGHVGGSAPRSGGPANIREKVSRETKTKDGAVSDMRSAAKKIAKETPDIVRGTDIAKEYFQSIGYTGLPVVKSPSDFDKVESEHPVMYTPTSFVTAQATASPNGHIGAANRTCSNMRSSAESLSAIWRCSLLSWSRNWLATPAS